MPRDPLIRSRLISTLTTLYRNLSALLEGRSVTRMATRQQRLNAFIHEGDPPVDQPLELLCEDHVGTYVIPFPCRWTNGDWQSVETGECIQATVIGWRTRDR